MTKYDFLLLNEDYDIKKADLNSKTKKSMESLNEDVLADKEKVNNKNNLSAGGSNDDINYLIDVKAKQEKERIQAEKEEEKKELDKKYKENAYNLFNSKSGSKTDPLQMIFNITSKLF